LDRIAKKNYIPTVEDILRLRTKTSGIQEVEFGVQEAYFRIVDVGGQRSERRKWFRCFDEVAAIIFFVALSEYDQFLSEDNTTNRMTESLKLFKEIVNNAIFEKTTFIMFMNKYDLFEKKIKKSPLNALFPGYKGGDDPVKGSEYIGKQFTTQAPPEKNFYVHNTTATDTESIHKLYYVLYNHLAYA
jgi:hypothetical protein